VINTTPYETVYCQTPPIHIPYVLGDSRVEYVDRTLQSREEATNKLMAHMERRFGKVNNRPVMYVLIQWTNRPVKEATWEVYADVLTRFPDYADVLARFPDFDAA
ncbi:reverse transcriptase, partial [Tanacetum coccineum]